MSLALTFNAPGRLAFLIAPLAATVPLAALSTGLSGGNVPTILVLSLVFYPYAFVATLLVAFPLFVFLQCRGWVNCWSALATGTLTGTLAAIVVRMPELEWNWGMASFPTIGAAAALVFWLIWRTGQ